MGELYLEVIKTLRIEKMVIWLNNILTNIRR